MFPLRPLRADPEVRLELCESAFFSSLPDRFRPPRLPRERFESLSPAEGGVSFEDSLPADRVFPVAGLVLRASAVLPTLFDRRAVGSGVTGTSDVSPPNRLSIVRVSQPFLATVLAAAMPAAAAWVPVALADALGFAAAICAAVSLTAAVAAGVGVLGVICATAGC